MMHAKFTTDGARETFHGETPEALVASMNRRQRFPNEDLERYMRSMAQRTRDVKGKDKKVSTKSAQEFLEGLQSAGMIRLWETTTEKEKGA